MVKKKRESGTSTESQISKHSPSTSSSRSIRNAHSPKTPKTPLSGSMRLRHASSQTNLNNLNTIEHVISIGGSPNSSTTIIMGDSRIKTTGDVTIRSSSPLQTKHSPPKGFVVELNDNKNEIPAQNNISSQTKHHSLRHDRTTFTNGPSTIIFPKPKLEQKLSTLEQSPSPTPSQSPSPPPYKFSATDFSNADNKDDAELFNEKPRKQSSSHLANNAKLLTKEQRKNSSSDAPDSEEKSEEKEAEETTQEKPASYWTLNNIAWQSGLFVTQASVSFIAGASSAINAMMNVVEKPPSYIGSEWWHGMSEGQKVESISVALMSLCVNYVFAKTSIPNAAKKGKKKLFKPNKTLNEKIEIGISIPMAISAAVAAAAIANDSFKWTYGIIDDFVTLSAFCVNLTTRFVGIGDLINRFRGAFNDDLKLRDKVILELGQIKGKLHFKNANVMASTAFKANGNKLDYEAINLFLENLEQQITDNYPDMLSIKTQSQVFLNNTQTSIESTLAAIIFAVAFATFMQKGFDGYNEMAERLADQSLLYINVMYKVLLGFLPGLANNMMYAIAALTHLSLVTDISTQLWNKPEFKTIIPFLVIMTFNVFASGSMQNVAQTILKNPDRICQFMSNDDTLGKTYVAFNRIGAFFVNGNATLKAIFGSPNTTNPEMVDFIKVLKEADFDSPIPAPTVKALHKFSTFASSKINPNSVASKAVTKTTATGYGTYDNGIDTSFGIESSSRPADKSLFHSASQIAKEKAKKLADIIGNNNKEPEKKPLRIL